MGKSLPFLSGREGRLYGSQWLEHLGLKHQTLNSRSIILIMIKRSPSESSWTRPARYAQRVSDECCPPCFDRWDTALAKTRLFWADEL